MRVEQIGDCTLYLGDCREILPTLPKVDAVITDPVWPTCPDGLFKGSSDNWNLLSSSLESIDANRVIVVIGWDCDPRWLSAVPLRWGFIRTQTMPYVFPAYSGKLLRGDEVAYCFGSVPKLNGVIPGRCRVDAYGKHSRDSGHPTERSLVHFSQLVGWWSEGCVLDQFMGSGTTGVACVQLGRKFIGIEIEPKYFDIACERISRAVAQGQLFEPEPQKQEQDALL